MYNVKQFRDLITRTLRDIDPKFASPVAVDLLLGTAAQESRLGTYLRQVSGPALGAFQVEPETFEWLKGKYKAQYPFLWKREAPALEWDLRLSILIARLRYWVVPDPLPKAGDIEAMASYYKKWYNTEKGKATTEEFVKNWERIVEKS